MSRRFPRNKEWCPECGRWLAKKLRDCPACGWSADGLWINGNHKTPWNVYLNPSSTTQIDRDSMVEAH